MLANEGFICFGGRPLNLEFCQCQMILALAINRSIRTLATMASSNPRRHNSTESSSDSDDPMRSESIRPLAAMVEGGISPRVILSHLAPSVPVPPGADDMFLWRMIVSLIEPPKRKKLPQYNTLEDAINLIRKSNKIMVLSGAGISTSAGLPDFRSRNGIYVQIHAEHPDLLDPKLVFDIEYFRKNPLPFYQFAKALYPGQYQPTTGHLFIKCIEDHNKLLRNYSQNIDTLEKQAGIKKVVECHGSFATASCTNCKYRVDGDAIKQDVFAEKIPKCPKCLNSREDNEEKLTVMKPDIVFFGEQLGDEFHVSMEADKDKVDLLIVIGSSLKVRPVALIPRSIPGNVPQILINREPLDHMGFDIELLGDCDHIIQEICFRLGGDWIKLCPDKKAQLTQAHPSTLKLLNLPDDNKTSIENAPDRNVQEGTQSVETMTDEHKEMNALKDETADERSSFKSNQAIVASESTEQNMIDELDEASRGESAMSNDSECKSDDWEDVEILDDSSSESLRVNMKDKTTVQLPESSFVLLKPNKYVFRGAELTRLQLQKYTKELDTSD